MICVSISDPAQLAPVIKLGAELIELRLDLLRILPEDLFPGIPKEVKTVVTCRPGEYNEEERIRLLISSMELGAEYVDLELESSVSFSEPIMLVAKALGCDVIFSYHDFNSTPGRDGLKRILEQCFERGGAMGKIATKVHNQQDIMNLLSLYNLPGRKVVLGMGAAGRVTRVMGPYLGGEFTFASPGDGEETAPGQLSMEQLHVIYKMIDG